MEAPAVMQAPVIKTQDTNWMRLIAVLACIAALGIACIVVPVLNLPQKPAPLFPLLHTGIEKMTWVPIALLAALGLVAGVATRAPVWAIAIASVALLPCAAIAEMVKDGTSHNLIPFEIIMYGFMAIPVLAMAAVGRFARNRFSKR
jgi:hypothetical protein